MQAKLSPYDRRRTEMANKRALCAGAANQAKREHRRDDIEYDRLAEFERETERLQILAAYQAAAHT